MLQKTGEKMAIFFNGRGEENREFKNTSPHSFTLDGEQWRSAEHYVQAQRFNCSEIQAEVRESTYPFSAKTIARERPEALRPDWHEIRDAVVEKAVRSKFQSHPDLSEKLCATGEAEIIEASAMSHHWGAGADGLGKNILGRILMKIRQDIKESLQMSGDTTENRIG